MAYSMIPMQEEFCDLFKVFGCIQSTLVEFNEDISKIRKPLENSKYLTEK